MDEVPRESRAETSKDTTHRKKHSSLAWLRREGEHYEILSPSPRQQASTPWS
jgi:hypothetical protein